MKHHRPAFLSVGRAGCRKSRVQAYCQAVELNHAPRAYEAQMGTGHAWHVEYMLARVASQQNHFVSVNNMVNPAARSRGRGRRGNLRGEPV